MSTREAEIQQWMTTGMTRQEAIAEIDFWQKVEEQNELESMYEHCLTTCKC
jgi:hypothetical protein